MITLPRILETRINGSIAVWPAHVHAAWVGAWRTLITDQQPGAYPRPLPAIIEWVNYTSQTAGIAAGFEWGAGRQCWRIVQQWAAIELGTLPSAGRQLTRPPLEARRLERPARAAEGSAAPPPRSGVEPDPRD